MGLMFRDFARCDDVNITIVLSITVALFALERITYTVDKILRCRRPGSNVLSNNEESEEDGDPTSVENLIRQPISFTLQRAFRHLEAFTGCLILIAIFSGIICLALVAIHIYFIATTIKIAIPGDFITTCDVNSFLSKFIMFGMLAVMILSALVKIVDRIWKLILTITGAGAGNSQPGELKVPKAYSCARIVVNNMLAFFYVVLFISLLVKLSKVWTSPMLESYEFITLGTVYPLFFILEGGLFEVKTEDTINGDTAVNINIA